MADARLLFRNGRQQVLVGVVHDKALVLPAASVAEVKRIGDRSGYWYEGNGADKAAAEKAIPGIRWRGSWDDLVPAPGKPDAFYYTLFANSDAGSRKVVAMLTGAGSIEAQLVKHADKWAHEVIRGHTDKASVLRFLAACGAGLSADAQKPATAGNLAAFIRKGGAAMFPSNWKDWPNPAGKVARQALTLRMEAVERKGAGVFFVGADNLALVQRGENELLAPAAAASRRNALAPAQGMPQ